MCGRFVLRILEILGDIKRKHQVGKPRCVNTWNVLWHQTIFSAQFMFQEMGLSTIQLASLCE